MTDAATALVIGGGIAGPVMALALRKAGIEAAVFEAYPGAADGIGGMLTVAPNGLAALGVLGIDDAVAAIGQPIGSMVMADGRGRVLGRMPGLTGLSPSRALWRADLSRVLRDQATGAGIEVWSGKRLVSVRESDHGVTAEFADGDTATGDVLIGADGIRSTVRGLIDPQAPGPDVVPLLNFGAAAAVSVPADPDAMYFVFGRRGFLGYWVQPDGTTAWFSNLPSDRALTIAQAGRVPAQEWLTLLADRYRDDVPGRELIAGTAPEQLVSLGSMEIMPSVPHWHRGRMVLVGDSAHAPSSSSGQGASLAIEGAIVLAQCLRDLPDLPAAFDRYESLRRVRVEKVAARAAKTNSSKGFGPLAQKVMGLLMPLAIKTVLNPERTLGAEQRFTIDWTAPVGPKGEPHRYASPAGSRPGRR